MKKLNYSELDDILKEFQNNNLSLEDTKNKINRLFNYVDWNVYNPNDITTKPTKYGKYFIRRNDGKVHWETYNGTGWAYNDNSITHWKEIK